MSPKLSILVLLVAGLAPACSSSLPLSEQSGQQLFRDQGCHRCHADDGSGSWLGLGPDLRDKGAFWDEDRLALYLEDPAIYAASDERLGERQMASYAHLDEEMRRRLARHVLSLMESTEG